MGSRSISKYETSFGLPHAEIDPENASEDGDHHNSTEEELELLKVFARETYGIHVIKTG